jgi:hypothetical protein
VTARPQVTDRITALILLTAARLTGRAHALAAALAAHIGAKRAQARAEPDAGYSTEAVIVIALLVAAAITVVGIITVKVIAKARSITFG